MQSSSSRPKTVSKGAVISLALVLAGCLVQENKGTTEGRVGNPVSIPPDFTFNPPPGSTNSGQGAISTPVQPPQVPTFGLRINSGDALTKLNLLQVQIFSPIRARMKISENSMCQDGQWEPFREFLEIPVHALNQRVDLSVQFQDFEGMTSTCHTASIVHDDKGPEILFSRFPLASIEEGSGAELIYDVTDSALVSDVKCRLNSLEKACSAGTNLVSITSLPEGSYTFTVEATDSLGNTATQTVTWSVVSTTRKLTQQVRVNNLKKVDILIVIDNSGSMAYEQQNMAQRVSSFLSIIHGLDWQIGVTTTDPGNIALGDGRLIPIFGLNGVSILDPSTPEADAQYKLGMTLQRPETGSGVEQGILATYRAVERSQSPGNPAHQQFFREGAQFATVVISDEDESANGPKNDPQNLIQLVHNTFGGQKTFTFHSIITKPGDTQCRSTNGATYGERYKQISSLTGGVVGSVCEADYGQQLAGVATGIRNMLKTLTLECQPLSQFAIEITKDGAAFTEPYTVEGVNLKFATELDPGLYSMNYRCLK